MGKVTQKGVLKEDHRRGCGGKVIQKRVWKCKVWDVDSGLALVVCYSCLVWFHG